MKGLDSYWFAFRLAWRQLVHDRAKMLAAILGVLFACVLVFMQLGFRDSLITSTATAPRKMTGDLFIIHKQTEALWRTVMFRRSILMRALGNQDVKLVYPMYINFGQFKNIDTQTKRTAMVFGADPNAGLLSSDDLRASAEALTQQDTVMFDRASRPEFGDVKTQLEDGRNITEISDHKVRIVGTFLMGTSFASDGNVVTSELNFHRMFPFRPMDMIDVGFVMLRDGADIEATKLALRDLLGEEVRVMDFEDFVAYEQDYWQNMAPIGFIFGFGVVMGLVVGMVIVYQILFTDISNNITEYATLKAMGYSQGYLVKVVFGSAAQLAVLGFIPGLFISLGLYHVAESNIYIPFPMPLSKILTVFFFILTMCMGAGALAIRKLRAANPADMF